MKNKIKYLIGIDEVGRGPLAGPVCVGAFMVRREFDFGVFKEARDSKKMTAGSRDRCFRQIEAEFGRRREVKFRFTISFVSPQKIDKLGLTKSIQLAINNCLKKLNLEPKECLVLLDGALRAPSKYIHQKTIIGGDDKEKIISLASIVAKVSRDRKMSRLSKKYPFYNFHEHKGYGTRKHILLIKKFGPSPLHRQSFLSNILSAAGNVIAPKSH